MDIPQITKQETITKALREELENRPFDQISVTDICNKSHCSRQTFYYYFTSLSDCLVNLFLEARSLSNQYTNYKEAASGLFNYVYENRNFISNVFSAGDQSMQVLSFLFKIIKDTMSRMMDKNNPESRNLLPEDKEYILSYYAAAWCFSFLGWVEGGFKTTPEQETEKMLLISEGSLINVADKFIKYRKENK